METVTFEKLVKSKLTTEDQQIFMNKFGVNSEVPLAAWCRIYSGIQIPLGYIQGQDIVPDCINSDLRDLAILSAKRAMPILKFYHPEVADVCYGLLERKVGTQEDRELFHSVCKKLDEFEKGSPPWFVIKAVIAAVGTPAVIIRSYHSDAHNYVLRAISGIGDFYPQFPTMHLYGDLGYEKAWQLVQLCNTVEKWSNNHFKEYKEQFNHVLACRERLNSDLARINMKG